jgi:ABC-type glycerol-3-phosphate transport system substrate-binding protein
MMDILQGKAPDLIQGDTLDYDNLARVGAFSDLYALMREDGKLAKEDFVTSILQTYEMDGQLYIIAPAFRLHTLLGAGSFVEGRNGLHAEEMIQWLESKGGSINSIDGFSADESVLTTLCGFNMDSFIDWSEGSCNFTGKEFQRILDFAKEYKGKPYESLYEAIQSGDIRLKTGIINSVEDYRLASEMFGEKVQMIGYPTERGNGSAALFGGGEMAINAKSTYQKEAWEFIKYFVQNGADGTSFPIMRDQFETYMNESMKEEEVIENGVSSKVLKISYREPNIADIQVTKCDPEDVEAIREVVNNISVKFQYHTEIQNIIEEEAAAYFSNQKKIEEVCEIIQNRVQLYLSES